MKVEPRTRSANGLKGEERASKGRKGFFLTALTGVATKGQELRLKALCPLKSRTPNYLWILDRLDDTPSA